MPSPFIFGTSTKFLFPLPLYSFQPSNTQRLQDHMIRNKMRQLIISKRSRSLADGSTLGRPQDNTLAQQPHWLEGFYHHKDLLHRIARNNESIAVLAREYRANPTVYLLKQAEGLITQNCSLIDEVDRWVGGFRYSPPSEPGSLQTEKGVCRYFQMALSQQILSVFNSKQAIGAVNSELDHYNSQYSFSQLNHSGFQNQSRSFVGGEMQDRNQVFQEVNYKIENLNIILRRMNALVASQGELINRIDENLLAGHERMRKGNEQLGRRVEREEGKGEFSCEGKVNQVITGLFLLNLGLILVFFVKNVFF